jgi:cytochrome o ubiquinol oxidase subunit IV
MAGHPETSKPYIIGYILSLLLTVAAFWLVLSHVMSSPPLGVTILLLASAQIFVQLFFFMHVKESDGPSYHGMALLLGAIFTVTVVFGSIWIMSFQAQVQ